MLKTALSYLITALNQYLGAPPDVAMLGNIAFAGESSGDSRPMKNQLVVSVINVEEDKISKDPLPYRQDGDTVRYQQPAVYLNLYLLVSANFDSYEDALTALGRVIEFFQHKSSYTPENTTDLPEGIDKLVFDLYNVTMDQVHHLWSMLGGRYLPSVVYKMRLLKIEQTEETPAALIRKIQTSQNVL
jgi:hypothetical protein